MAARYSRIASRMFRVLQIQCHPGGAAGQSGHEMLKPFSDLPTTTFVIHWSTSRRLYVSIRQLTIPQNGKDASAVRRLYTANQTVSFQANDWCKGESDFNSKRLDFNPTFVKFNSEVVHFNSKCKVRTQN